MAPSFREKRRLKADKELYLMMQIAAEKHCWLADLDDIPLEEINLWAAYYDLEAERIEKKRIESENQSSRRARRGR